MNAQSTDSSPTTSKRNTSLIPFQLLKFSTNSVSNGTTKPGHMPSDFLHPFLPQSHASAVNTASLLIGYRVGAGAGRQHRSFLYIQSHSMPGPLSYSLCAPGWLLPVSGKDGKLQEGSEGACSVLWTVVQQLLESKANYCC